VIGPGFADRFTTRPPFGTFQAASAQPHSHSAPVLGLHAEARVSEGVERSAAAATAIISLVMTHLTQSHCLSLQEPCAAREAHNLRESLSGDQNAVQLLNHMVFRNYFLNAV
jgi:hypothetical protein